MQPENLFKILKYLPKEKLDKIFKNVENSEELKTFLINVEISIIGKRDINYIFKIVYKSYKLNRIDLVKNIFSNITNIKSKMVVIMFLRKEPEYFHDIYDIAIQQNNFKQF